MQLEPVSQAELHSVEGGMINLDRLRPIETPDPSGGMGYTGKMVTFSLTVIDGGTIPC